MRAAAHAAAIAATFAPAVAQPATGSVEVARLCLRVADFMSYISLLATSSQPVEERLAEYRRLLDAYDVDRRLFSIVGGAVAITVLNSDVKSRFDDVVSSCISNGCPEDFMKLSEGLHHDFWTACNIDYKGVN